MKSNVNMMLQSQLQIGYVLVALELHNSCSYTIAIELHELHTYMVPHTVYWICCNSCNSSNNTHSIEICWFVMKLQMVIATQKHNCKASCKSFYFSLWDHTITTKVLHIFIPMLKYIFKKQLKSIGVSPHAWKED
jgi:hypothetical protein